MTDKKNEGISNKIERIYQYANGEYLPDSSQPNAKLLKIYTPHKSTRYKNVNKGIAENCTECHKPLPELYTSRENCCGCSACFAICSKKAISMEPDEEGFLYPVVNIKECIRCYKCLKVCVFKEAQKNVLRPLI